MDEHFIIPLAEGEQIFRQCTLPPNHLLTLTNRRVIKHTQERIGKQELISSEQIPVRTIDRIEFQRTNRSGSRRVPGIILLILGVLLGAAGGLFLAFKWVDIFPLFLGVAILGGVFIIIGIVLTALTFQNLINYSLTLKTDKENSIVFSLSPENASKTMVFSLDKESGPDKFVFNSGQEKTAMLADDKNKGSLNPKLSLLQDELPAIILDIQRDAQMAYERWIEPVNHDVVIN